MIETIKNWSSQKKVFIGLTSAAVAIGLAWGVSKIIDINKNPNPKKKK